VGLDPASFSQSSNTCDGPLANSLATLRITHRLEVSIRAKVCGITADVPIMEYEPYVLFGPGHPRCLQARAPALSVPAIRNAQGKEEFGQLPDRLAGMGRGGRRLRARCAMGAWWCPGQSQSRLHVMDCGKLRNFVSVNRNAASVGRPSPVPLGDSMINHARSSSDSQRSRTRIR
jgi:hypothetical protein